MQVRIDNKVHAEIERFYAIAMGLHVSLDKATVDAKKSRLYAAMNMLGRYPGIYPIAKGRVWAAKHYQEMICEDFHFAFRIVRSNNGNEYVYIFDAKHSLLYHD